jgi:hypothetical protein
VAVPKVVLQQHCHNNKPQLPNPRFNKTSRQGELFRYSCTIVFPKVPAKKKISGVISGPKTWGLIESDDGWDDIQDAQNVVALKALLDLVPNLTDSYRLLPPFKCASALPSSYTSEPLPWTLFAQPAAALRTAPAFPASAFNALGSKQSPSNFLLSTLAPVNASDSFDIKVQGREKTIAKQNIVPATVRANTYNLHSKLICSEVWLPLPYHCK